MATAALSALVAAGAHAWPSTLRPLPGSPADGRLAAVPIDFPGHNDARRCIHRVMPGTRALLRWLDQRVYGRPFSTLRCRTLAHGRPGLHAEGRAVDWALDAFDARERRVGDLLVRVLLMPDRQGNPYALARRMGVQEVYWDCLRWSMGDALAGGPAVRRLSVCPGSYSPENGGALPTNRWASHTNHVHIGLHWRGALGRTTFWAYGRALGLWR